jgi:hypothetical protein
MIPETGERSEFKDFVLHMPMVGDLYSVKGWKGHGLWRVVRVSDKHIFFEKFAGNIRKKLLLTSWRKFISDGRVSPFTKDSPALNDFQRACTDWLKLRDEGEFSIVHSMGAGKSYLHGLQMGALLMKEGWRHDP